MGLHNFKKREMVNKCIFIGNLGKDPEVKQTESGHNVARFSIACSRRFKKKGTEELVEQTEWINIIAWDQLAEVVNKYAHKGTQVYVEGELRNRSYENENKVTQYITEIWAKDIRLLGKKTESTPLPSSTE